MPVAAKFSKETYLYWYELMQLIRQFELMAVKRWVKMFHWYAAYSMPARAAMLSASLRVNPAATLEQRRAALRPALDGGRLKTSDVLTILTAKDETPAVPTKPTAGRVQTPRPDLLAQALAEGPHRRVLFGAVAVRHDNGHRHVEAPRKARRHSDGGGRA